MIRTKDLVQGLTYPYAYTI